MFIFFTTRSQHKPSLSMHRYFNSRYFEMILEQFFPCSLCWKKSSSTRSLQVCFPLQLKSHNSNYTHCKNEYEWLFGKFVVFTGKQFYKFSKFFILSKTILSLKSANFPRNLNKFGQEEENNQMMRITTTTNL